MALIQCRECGKTISTEAAACPQCGAPQQQTPPKLPGEAPPIEQRRNAQEETLHSDNVVSVTTTRVIIRGTTYALRNITSVRMAFTPPKTGCAIILLIFGIIALLGAFVGFSQSVGSGIVGLIFAGVIIGLAILWLRSLKTDYHVAIASSSGEANALTSKDKAYIEHIVNSINEAIVKYR
ncbi:MAG: DUF6232 family protein [Bryobacteraceae bacterium]